MKICILQPSYEGSSSPCGGLDPDACPQKWLDPTHEVHIVHIKKASSAREITRLKKQNFDVFINLCDGAWDEDRAGKDVVEALERLNLPYTGADLNFFEPSKELMKRVAIYQGVGTAAFQVYHSVDELEDSHSDSFKFPVIVKHPSGYNSIAMTPHSKCETREELKVQAAGMIQEFGSVLVEEFIEGKEYTVLVSENPSDPLNPRTYQPVECKFPPGESFKHFDLKWVNHRGIEWVPVEDQETDKKLRQMARTMFLGLNGTGYGRLDVREDRTDNLYFLEINPNCGIFYPPEDKGSADYILALDPHASHEQFLEEIIQCAIQRHRQKQPKYTVRFCSKRKGFGLVALQDICESEAVDMLEEGPCHLVTKGHVDAMWDEQKKIWFRQYAYPLSQNVWAMWSPKPAEWKPLNHSCNPNTWLQGLNLVARRLIQEGEELTIDYATFCVDSEDFSCSCGDPQCRGRVTGLDYLAPWVGKKYGDHISDFVRQARIAAARILME